MAVLFGLAVAAAYGAADFLGGLSSKRWSTATVVIISQAFSLGMLAVLILVVPDQQPAARDLLLGTGAGVGSGAGLVLLYKGLASGRMSLVAPVTGVGAAVVPFTWGVARGERPSTAGLVGVALALLAVVLVSRIPSDPIAAVAGTASPPAGGPPVLALAAGAGIAFGAVFILLGETAAQAGLWPIVASRITLINLLVAGVMATGRSVSLGRPGLGLVAGTGALDLTANALYLVAVRQGLLSLVAVLSSLYPAATVLLARVVLGERLTRVQLAGLAMAGAGVTLIAAG